MSETEKLQSVKGVVQKANPGGVLIAGAWYDYDDSFEGEKPGREIVGQEVELAISGADENGKPLFNALEVCGEILGNPEGGEKPAPESAPKGAGPSDDRPSPKQVEFAKLMTEKAGLTDDDVEQLSQIRFKKAFADLTKREVSWTISYLGAGTPGRSRSKSKKQ